MHCTHFDHSAEELTHCGNEDFDVTVAAMLTADLSGDEPDFTIELDGIAHEDIDVVCKKCGGKLTDSDIEKAVTVLILKLEKRLGARLQPFSSYGFSDGTKIDPAKLQVTPLKDVEAGTAYQAAQKHQAQYAQWLAVQADRISSGDISDADLGVMRIPWREASDRYLRDLLDELSA